MKATNRLAPITLAAIGVLVAGARTSPAQAPAGTATAVDTLTHPAWTRSVSPIVASIERSVS